MEDAAQFKKFKVDVLDSKSKSFCAAKWLGSTIWLSQGKTSSCHLPRPHAIDLSLIEQNPSALHNTPHKLATRQQMLVGEKPSECQYCWDSENLNETHLSERVFKSFQFGEAAINKIYEQKQSSHTRPHYLEISFDRKCQLSCSYCSTLHSSTWANELESRGYFNQLISHDAHFYNLSAEHNLLSESDQQKVFEAFKKWWPDLKTDLKHLRVTGGEPLMSKNFWEFLDEVQKDSEESLEMDFSVNTNLMWSELHLEKLIRATARFKKFNIYTSCEATGSVAEYIRSGLNYDTWKSRLEFVLNQKQVHQVFVMMTVNALSLINIKSFLEEILELKIKYGPDRLKLSSNLLRFPVFQNICVWPDIYRSQKAQQLRLWLEHKDVEKYFETFELQQLGRILAFMSVPTTKTIQGSPIEWVRRDFFHFYRQYDKRFQLNLKSILPEELRGWFDYLESISQNKEIEV